jgi:hypothetical protein
VAVADNHNHDDQLSFILEAEGQMMCSDAGYSRGTYTGEERTKWYNTAPAHNTLTFEGKPAVDSAPNATPPSRFRTDQPGLVGEEKEAGFGRDGKTATWRRGVWCIAGDFYVVNDRLNAAHPGRIAGFLHGGRGTLESAGARRTWTYSADRYGSAAQLHSWIAAPGATLLEKGELTYIKGDYAEFPYLAVETTAQDSAWLTLLQPARQPSGSAIEVRDLSTPAVAALEIDAAGSRTVAVTQARAGGNLALKEVATDGVFALVRCDTAGRPVSFVVLEGTTLSVAGRQLWHSETRQSVARNVPH